MHCQPAAAIITRLGGLTALAEACDVSVTSVQRWRLPAAKGGTGGIIPAKYYPVLIKHAANRGVRMPLAAFVDPEVAATLARAKRQG